MGNSTRLLHLMRAACSMPLADCPAVPSEMFVCLSVEKCIKMRGMQMQNAECIPLCHGQHLHLSNNNNNNYNKLHFAWPAAAAAAATDSGLWGLGSSSGNNF